MTMTFSVVMLLGGVRLCRLEGEIYISILARSRMTFTGSILNIT